MKSLTGSITSPSFSLLIPLYLHSHSSASTLCPPFPPLTPSSPGFSHPLHLWVYFYVWSWMLWPLSGLADWAAGGREGGRTCSVITTAPPGCWEAEITSDFKVRGSNTASVAIVTGRSLCVCVCCLCACVCVNSLGDLLCMIHTVTSLDGITVLLLIYSQKIPAL